MTKKSFAAGIVLLVAAGCASPQAGRVAAAPAIVPASNEILWDRWGVPHVYGRDDEGAAYGFGWAQAEAHGDLILRLYGRARGRAAEYWGERYAASDRVVRTMGIPGRAEEWHAAQSPEARRRLDAFVAGFNAYASAHPEKLRADNRAMLPVTATDVLGHMQHVIHFSFLSQPADVAAGIAPSRREAGSNAWAIAPSRSASGNAMLLANPHLPWSGYFLWFEAQIAAPGMDAYGAALVGFPFLGIAFNDHLGWTHTVNTLDGADVYELTLAPGGYRWDGGVRAFETRTDTFRVRGADGSFRTEILPIRSSVHGPVLGERDGKAYAYRVAGLDQPHLYDQYWDMARARNFAEFETAVKRLQMPMFTVMYADREGRVMHLFNGQVPERSGGTFEDWSGVVPGDDPSTLWTGTLPYERLPRVVDPASGWLQNANDPPWTTTFPLALRPDDFPAYVAPRQMDFRPQVSARMLMADSSITFEEMIEYKHSTRVETADRFLDDLLAAAAAHGTPAAKSAAEVLARWDRNTDAESRGAVLFKAWVHVMGERAQGRSPYAVPWSESDPLRTPRGLADPAAAAAALDAAAEMVKEAYGGLDVAWGDVNRLRLGSVDLPANGADDQLGVFHSLWTEPGEDGRFSAVGGDTYVAAVEFSDPVRARALLPYGNATQAHSPHRGDQLPLFSRKELRPVWRTRAEVEANLSSRQEL